MAAAPDLKGSRRDLALVLADGRWRTANEVARALGKPTGAIFGLVRRMHADGLLKADAEEPIRGTQYRLTAMGKSALEEALQEAKAVGQLGGGQWLMVVERGVDGPRLADFQTVIDETRISGNIAWGATLGWGWLLVFAPETPEFAIERLTLAFEKPGFRCRVAQPKSVLSGNDFRERASTLVAELEAAT